MIERMCTSPRNPPSAPGDALINTTQHEFPVVDGSGRLRGVLTRNAMIRALHQHGPGHSVLEVMDQDIPVVPLSTRLDIALDQMQSVNAPAIGITDGDSRLVGYITAENVGELMMIRDAPAGRDDTASGPWSR